MCFTRQVSCWVDDLCEAAKREMKDKNDGLVTASCDLIQPEGYIGIRWLRVASTKSAEGYAARITLPRRRGWTLPFSSSAKAVREIFPSAEIMLCGGHADRAHKEEHRKDSMLMATIDETGLTTRNDHVIFTLK